MHASIFFTVDINEDQHYLPFFVMALTIMLAIFTVALIVVKSNSPNFTSNKLTMSTHYMTLLYTAALMIQMILAVSFLNDQLYLLNLVNLVKMSIQSGTVSVQAYEWFALYKMIAFQA
jgi:hypothetical protein